MSGVVDADGADGVLTINAGRDLTVEGVLAEGAAADALPAPSTLLAKAAIELTAGRNVTIAASGLVGGTGPSDIQVATIDITAGANVVISGALYALDAIAVQAADDITLDGTVLGGTVATTAGTDGSGSVIGTIYADVTATGGGSGFAPMMMSFAAAAAPTGGITMTAGGTAGSVQLTNSTLTTNATVSLNALGGAVNHSGGVITAGLLKVRSLSGVTGNLAVGSVDAEVSGTGGINLIASGDVALDNLTTANGAIAVDGFGSIAANKVKALGTSDASSVTLRTRKVGANASNLTVQDVSAGGKNGVSFDIAGDIEQSEGLLSGDALTLKLAGGVSLITQVNTLSLSTTSSGNVDITNLGGGTLTLKDIKILDGALSVNAAGTIVAQSVRSLTDADANDITLTSSAGSIQIGLVQAGTYAGNTDEADAIRLRYFNGALRSAGAIDPRAQDWTLTQARALDPASQQYAGLRSKLVTFLRTQAGFGSDDAAAAEADAILRLTKTIASAGDVTLSALKGSIQGTSTAGTAALIADQMTLSSSTGIAGLQVAANALANAQVANGSIQIADLDGVGSQVAGLTVTRAAASSSNDKTPAVVDIQAQGALTVSSADALGANSRVRLQSLNDNLLVTGSGGSNAVNASGGVSLLAGGLVRVDGALSPVQSLVEVRAGTDFQTTGSSSFTADSIIIETGRTLEINGDLRARDLLQVSSTNGNVIVTGSLGARDQSGLGRLIINAQGTTPIVESVIDAESGFLRYTDAQRPHLPQGRGERHVL